MSPENWLSKLQQHGYRQPGPAGGDRTVATSPAALTPIQVYDLARQHYRVGSRLRSQDHRKTRGIGLVNVLSQPDVRRSSRPVEGIST
jgi:hypothetical protein